MRSYTSAHSDLVAPPHRATLRLDPQDHARLVVEQPALAGPLNRLTYGIMIAALFLGSALLWGLSAPPVLWGVSVFGFLGVLLGVGLGAHLLFLMWRSG